MSIWKVGLLAIMIPTSVALPAVAQGGEGELPRFLFEELDADSSGTITLEEMQITAQARFARADADGNGSLSREELISQSQSRVEQRVDRLLDHADVDGDGEVSMTELHEARIGRGRRGPDPERIFSRLDTDGDGSVTEAEFDQGAMRFLDRMGHRSGDHNQ